MISDILEQIKGEVLKYSVYGFSEFSDGTLFVSHYDWIGSLAWGFKLFSQIRDFESDILLRMVDVPPSYRDLLGINNGLNIFRALSLYGYQDLNSPIRPKDAQPYSLRLLNVLEPSLLIKDGYFSFGVYGYDYTEVFMHRETGEIVVSNKKKSPLNILARWPNIDEFLIQEFFRLKAISNERGFINERSKTVDF